MPPPATRSRRAASLMLATVLAVIAAISLMWSHHKLLNQDEIFVLQTDSVPTAAEVLHIQLHSPISLDPPVYHLLVHASLRAFGATPFALRLPSIFGFLLMQVCLYMYVRRAANYRAALFAAAFPAITATLYYSVEARPYGLLLGLFALALAAYQSATRAVDMPTPEAPLTRTAALWTLTAAIAVALNVHYFAVLLLPPLYVAELARTVARRKLDTPVVAAVVAGTAAFVSTIPFQRAAAAFRVHYYNPASANVHAITQAYRSLLVDYTRTSLSTQRAVASGLVLLALCFLVALAVRWRSLRLPAGEAAFLLTLTAFPFFGYVLARFVTHSIEVRYVLGAIIAIAALLAMLAAPLLDRVPCTSFALLVTAIIVIGVSHVRLETRRSREILASLKAPPALEAALASDPARKVYIQELGRFEEARYNTPDAVLRDHLALVYSSERELRIDHHDTEALTAQHLAQFSSLQIVSYDQLLADPTTPHILLIDRPNGWQWIDFALAGDGASVTPISPWFEGEIVETKLSAPNH